MLENIPQELLLSIFGMINYEDIKSLRQTCKNCYYASLNYSIIKNEVINLDDRFNKSQANSVIDSLKKTERIFFHLTVSDNYENNYLWIFSKFGPWLKTISFKNCSIEYLQLTYILKQLESLEMLRISNCTNLLIDGRSFLLQSETPKLSHVKSLEITHTKYLTDEALHRFFIMFPNVEHLSIEETTMNCHGGVFQFNYKSSTNILNTPSANVLTKQFVKALIESKQSQINSLNFSKTIINNAVLKEIMEIDDLKLTRLNLNCCRELRQTQFIYLGSWQPNITELQISACDFVDNTFLMHIALTMRNLRVLNISHNTSITDSGFKFIGYFEQIANLDISNCLDIHSNTICKVLTSKKTIVKNLKVLRIKRTSIRGDDFIKMLTVLQLTELDISDCGYLQNYAMYIIFSSQKLLRKLEMSGIQVTGFLPLFNPLNVPMPMIDLCQYKLRQMVSSEVQEEIYSDSLSLYTAVTDLHNSMKCYEDLPNLESLNISRCFMLNDLLLPIPNRLDSLRELKLSGLIKMTSKSMMFIPHKYPTLEKLDISGTLVDDVGICVVVRKLHRLKYLNLMNTLVTNISLVYIKEHCKNLQYLNIQGCFDLSDTLLKEIRRLPTLIKVIGRPVKTLDTNVYIPDPPANA